MHFESAISHQPTHLHPSLIAGLSRQVPEELPNLERLSEAKAPQRIWRMRLVFGDIIAQW